jgi:CRISPR/Cas system-associated exonuclease Cas4 (RecB family)
MQLSVPATILSIRPDNKDLFTLSVSKVKTFDDCKAQYRFNYIEKLPKKDWDFLIFGKFIHHSLEAFHKALIEDSSQDINDLMKICFDSSSEEYKEKITEVQKTDIWTILTKYIAKPKKPTSNIISVEKPFYIDIDGKILLNGYIDRVQIDADGVLHVADYKTTKDKKYLKDFFQLQTYAFVLMLENPDVEVVRASFILLRHDFEFLTKEYTRKDIAPIAEKFLTYADQINEEQLWRPNPKFLCKFCSFLESCEEGKNYLDKKGIVKKAKSTSKFGLSEW